MTTKTTTTSRRPAPPPATRIEPLTENRHGVAVRDDYRWLENENADEVRAWTEAQGRYTRDWLDGAPARAALAQRLTALFAIGTLTPPHPARGRYFHERREGSEEQPRLYVRDAANEADRVLVDPARAAIDAAQALDWWYPSPDGRLLAYGVSEGGSEQSTLRVVDVATGRLLSEAISRTRACSLEWLPDASGFYYTRYPDPSSVAPGDESYFRRVFLHRLGDDPDADALAFTDERPKEDWPNVHLSPDGRFLVVSIARGWTRTDVYLRDNAAGTPFAAVVEGVESLFGVVLRDDALYLLTNDGAPRFRLVALDPSRPSHPWREVLREGEDVLESVGVVGDRIVAQWIHDAAARVTLHDRAGRLLGEVETPSIGSVAGLTGEWDGTEAFFGFSSYTRPPEVYRIDTSTGAVSLWGRVAADVDLDAFHVRRTETRSKDGTAVSMFLVSRRDRPDDGRGAVVLTGYGGFNVSLTPTFARSIVPFLDQGGLFAVAHLRGGGERGEAWHRAGMRENKQNVFDDFVAAAEHLVAARHGAKDRVAIMGGSNGGLLVGAALTQRPDLFRAVVCQVPLLDMLRYQLFRIARLWIPEYGDPDVAEEFGWLRAYSPYHRVVDGARYPAVLLTTGESDSRVDPLHARKMAARLQAATASGLPVLLRVETRAGHGQGKPISKVIAEWTDTWAFLFEELGIAPR